MPLFTDEARDEPWSVVKGEHVTILGLFDASLALVSWRKQHQARHPVFVICLVPCSTRFCSAMWDTGGEFHLLNLLCWSWLWRMVGVPLASRSHFCCVGGGRQTARPDAAGHGQVFHGALCFFFPFPSGAKTTTHVEAKKKGRKLLGKIGDSGVLFTCSFTYYLLPKQVSCSLNLKKRKILPLCSISFLNNNWAKRQRKARYRSCKHNTSRKKKWLSKLQFSEDNFYLVAVNCNGDKKIVKVTKNHFYFSRYSCNLYRIKAPSSVSDIYCCDKVFFFMRAILTLWKIDQPSIRLT